MNVDRQRDAAVADQGQPQFRDVRAIIFAKHSSANWVELARYDLPRQILTK